MVAQPTGPAHHRLLPCRLPPASRSSCVLARARPRRPPPPCLAASSFPGPSRDATQPRPPLTSPSLSGPPSPSLLCFPSRDRTEPPPPTRATVATGHPTAHRRPRKLRRSSLYLLNEPRGPGRATTPPSMPSSTSGPPAIFVKFAGSGPSPRHRRESLTLSPNSACSPPCRSAVPHEHRSHRPPLLLHA